MFIFGAGMIVGFILSWMSMMIDIENYIYKDEKDRILIDELTDEVEGYKKALERRREEFDEDYWG